MTAKYLLIQYCSNWETVETVRKRFPQFNVVPPFTLERKTNWKINFYYETQANMKRARDGVPLELALIKLSQ